MKKRKRDGADDTVVYATMLLGFMMHMFPPGVDGAPYVKQARETASFMPAFRAS